MSRATLRNAVRPFFIPILFAIGTSLAASWPATAQDCYDLCYIEHMQCSNACHQQGGCGYGCDQSCYESCDANNLACVAGCYPPVNPTWTVWLDRDEPDGTGDWETVAEFRATGNNICNGATPIGIECQILTGVDWTLIGQNYTCNAATGGVCRNSDQQYNNCLDYRVRFLCP